MECPSCGYTGISQLEYDLYECQMCGYRGPESDFEGGGDTPHYHSYYYSYNVSTTTLSETPATCTTSGSRKVQKVDRYVCSCGDWENRTSTSTQTIAALGHDFTYTSTVAPGLATDGYDLYTCSRCYITEQRNLTKATGSPSWTPMRTKTNNAWTNITNVFYKTPAAWIKMNGYYAKDNNSWNVPVIEYDEPSVVVTTTAKGSYYFTNSNGTFSPNNTGIHGTSATTTLSVVNNVSVTVSWSVSSESGWDKFTVIADGSTKANAVSGSNSGSFTLAAGTHTIYLTYTKDNSGASGSDAGTITFGVPIIHVDNVSGGTSGGGTTGGGTTDTRSYCPVTNCSGRLDESGYGYRCDTCGQYTTYCSKCNNGEFAYPDGMGLWCTGHGGYIDTYGDPIE